MYLDFIEGEQKDAVTFLVDRLGHKDGSDRFILAVKDSLRLSNQKLVWWIDIFNKYHNHPDYNYESLLRTRRHFKNIAFTCLDNGNYKMFNVWIKNWADLLVIFRYAYPERWETKPLENIK